MTIAHLLEAAIQHHQAGSISQARELYQQVLQQQPNHVAALNLMGVLSSQAGDLKAGIAFYYRALERQPRFVEAHHNLALALQLVGRIPDAIAHYRIALSLEPNNPETHHNLATLLVQQGQPEPAFRHYQAAIALRPDYATAYVNLGLLYAQQQQFEAAIAAMQQAIRHQPSDAQIYWQLADLFAMQGRVEESLTYLQQARSLQSHPQIEYSLGKALEEQGDVAAAIAQFRAVLQQQPENAEAVWHQHLILPILYDTPDQIVTQRQYFCRGFNQLLRHLDLTTPQGQAFALCGLASRTNFYLAYQGLNDRGLQAKYGRLIHKIMAANYPQWVQPLPVPPVENGKIRVGYLSANLMAHSAAAWARGWIQAHDRARFEVYCYHIGQRVDAVTLEFRALSDRFRHFPAPLEAIAAQVLADQLHVLIFTDIGMDARTSQLAGLRLAPVQCTAWGHPVTSGIPTIDYYLSSDLMEPETASQHYTETLVRLPNIGICYRRPPLPDCQDTRSDFGLRNDAILYLSLQSPYKYLPQHDHVFAEIARRVPNAQFVFLQPGSTRLLERFQQRFQRAFAELDLESSDFCRFLPKLERDRFWRLNLLADVALDAVSWSGGNSTLEAVGYGLPVVAYAGAFMRSRHSAAILQRLGVTDTIAHTEADYIEIAARLGLQSGWRDSISERLYDGHHRLYDDRECVVALENFFRTVSGDAAVNLSDD
jgi:predicted O-linked N-acetylglucosamine transferase (SPINDLY family)